MEIPEEYIFFWKTLNKKVSEFFRGYPMMVTLTMTLRPNDGQIQFFKWESSLSFTDSAVLNLVENLIALRGHGWSQSQRQIKRKIFRPFRIHNWKGGSHLKILNIIIIRRSMIIFICQIIVLAGLTGWNVIFCQIFPFFV